MAPLWCKLQALAVVPDRVEDKISRRRWQFHKFVSNIDVRYRGGVRCPSPVECADLPTLLVNGALVFKTYPRPCLTDVHYNTPTFHLDGDLTARTQHARFKTRQVVTQVERMDPSIHPSHEATIVPSRHVNKNRSRRTQNKHHVTSPRVLTIRPIVAQTGRSALGLVSSFARGLARRLPSSSSSSSS